MYKKCHLYLRCVKSSLVQRVNWKKPGGIGGGLSAATMSYVKAPHSPGCSDSADRYSIGPRGQLGLPRRCVPTQKPRVPDQITGHKVRTRLVGRKHLGRFSDKPGKENLASGMDITRQSRAPQLSFKSGATTTGCTENRLCAKWQSNSSNLEHLTPKHAYIQRAALRSRSNARPRLPCNGIYDQVTLDVVFCAYG